MHPRRSGRGNRELARLVVEVRKKNPPGFGGGDDPLKAEQWMSMITSILDFMQVENNDQFKCDIYMLREDARICWEIVSQGHDLNNMTWDAFQILFYEKYYNESIRAAKVKEFI
uniref:Gag-pol polyprotein n=1 Tax=Cannabis sativa TaxID=3483 RepID=A0A803PSH1_CANSA